MTNPYLKQYQKNEVETASPEKILILLYSGAIQFLNKAKIAMQEENLQEIHNNLIGCQNIIVEFINSLNDEEGPELAENLRRLYQYLYDTLVQANLKKDEKKIDEVLHHLTKLRETWIKAIAIANRERQNALSSATQNTNSSKKPSYDSSALKNDDNDDEDDDDDDDEKNTSEDRWG